MKRKWLILLSATAVLALLATSANATTVLDLKLECDKVASGSDYDVRIYARVTGTGEEEGSEEGVADTEFTITSAGSTGKTDSVEKTPPPSSGKVVTTWATTIATNFTTMAPLYQDEGTDGDYDAYKAAFSDMGDYNDITVGIGGWELIATEKWHMNANEQVFLTISVNSGSRHFDWSVASPYKTEFESVVGTGCWAGVPEPATLSLLALGGLGVLIRRKRS